MYYARKICMMRIKYALHVSHMYYAYKICNMRIKYALCVYKSLAYHTKKNRRELGK